MNAGRSLMMLLFVVVFGCTAPKEYTIGDKAVTKRKYDRGLDRITRRYVKSLTPEQLSLLSELQVVYDTTSTQ